jgi:hypothetical protein
MLRCERGDPIIEFIFIVPLMLLLGFGIMEIGRVLWYQHSITKGVRDGTRYLTRVPLAGLPGCTPVSSTAVDCKAPVDALTVATCLALAGAHWGEPKLDTIKVSLCPVPHDGPSAGGFYGPNPLHMVKMTAQVPIDFPILNAFLKTGQSVTFTISNQARHIGQ